MDSDRTPAVTSFSLRHLIREVRSASALVDPHDIAKEVGRHIDDRDLRAALDQCLSYAVREVIRHSRNGGLPSFPPEPSTPSGPRLTLHTQSQPEVMAEQSGGVPRPVIKAAPVRRPTPSAKVAAIRAAGPKWLSDELRISADPRGWKRIGDCSFTDLMFAVAERRDQAARTSAAAGRYERLAELVRAHGVDRVRDLPTSVLAEVGGAAA